MEKTKNELLRQSEKFIEEEMRQGKITQEKKDEILETLRKSTDGKGFFDFLSKKLGTKVDIKDKNSLRKMIEEKGLNFDELWSDYVNFLRKSNKVVRKKSTKEIAEKKELKDKIAELEGENEELKDGIAELEGKNKELKDGIVELEGENKKQKDRIAELEGENKKQKDRIAELKGEKITEKIEDFESEIEYSKVDFSLLDKFSEQPDWNGLSMKQKIERFSLLLFSNGIAKTEKIELGKEVTITIPGEEKITFMFSTGGRPEACPRYDEIMDYDIEDRKNTSAKQFGLMCKSKGCEMLSMNTVKQTVGILYKLFNKLGENSIDINSNKDLYTFAIILFQSLGSHPRGIRLSDKNLRTDYGGHTLYSLLYYPREDGNMYEIKGLCDGDRDQRYLAFCKIG